jgi:hypothetical protein
MKYKKQSSLVPGANGRRVGVGVAVAGFVLVKVTFLTEELRMKSVSAAHALYIAIYVHGSPVGPGM